MNSKHKFDFKSIRFKLWIYFVGFALILIGIIWFLQVFFLNYFYEEMKTDEVSKLSNQIVESFEQSNYDLYALANTLNDISAYNADAYFRVETTTGENIISPGYSGYGPLYRYDHQIEELRVTLLSSPHLPSVSKISRTIGLEEDSRVLAYACYLTQPSSHEGTVSGYEDFLESSTESYILYIISPLYPVKSTIQILRSQLIDVTIIAIILAFALALYLASRISKPIKDITHSAAEMGRGHYGIQFEGGHYTEIIDLADTLTHASQELEKTDMYQKDLIANVSHDLRTPLTMIQSYAEMIRDLSGNIPEKREAHLNVIIEETHRLNTLVTDMLNLSRMQNRSIQLEREDFDIYETAKSLLASYDLLCEQEGYKIQFNAMAPLWVNGDEARIKQVLSNLINNAVKFCGEDKEIIINLKRIGRKVRCEVVDHGKGIAPDEINHVWERYYKSSTHHVRPTDGTGLGLSIVKEILTLHKANYGVSSKLGKGSTFWFEMELVKAKK